MEAMEIAEEGDPKSPRLQPRNRARRFIFWFLGRWPYWITLLSLVAVALVAFLLIPRGGGYHPDHHVDLNSGVANHRDLDTKEQEQEQQVCNSKACIRTAATFRTSMDTNVSPCEDFFKFSCGKWNSVLSRGSNHSVDYPTVLRDQKQEKTLNLTKQINSSDIEALQQLKKLYQSCMDTNFESVIQVSHRDIMDLLDRLFLPGDTIGKTMARINRDLGVTLMLGVDIAPKKGNSSGWEFVVGQPEIAKADLLDETTAFQTRSAPMLNVFKTFNGQIELLAKKLGIVMDGSMSEKTLDLDKWLAFRLRGPAEPVEAGNDKYLTVKELNKEGSPGHEYETATEAMGKIDWIEYMETLFDGVTGITITEGFTVNVRDVRYVEAVGNHLAATPVSHIRMSLIGRLLLALATKLGAPLVPEDIPGLSTTCHQIMENRMPFAVAHLLARREDNMDKVAVVENMMSFVSKSFKSMISGLDWMDSKAKVLATRKVDGIKTHIGYPPWLLNSSNVDEYYRGVNLASEGTVLQNIFALMKWRSEKKLNEFNRTTPPDIWRILDTSPAVVNAIYVGEVNVILIPTGYLQFPYFGSGISAIDYGSLGSAMGHEIAHGFGVRGNNRDETGGLASSFNFTYGDSYKAKTHCFIEQYERYWTPVFGQNGKMTNGERTLEENIADNAGIHAGFEAFKMYMNSIGAPEQALPGLEKYTSEQLFFLSFAHSECSYEGLVGADARVGQVSHSPNWMRVMGTLSNYEEFSRIWQCPQGSGMNPEKKCVLWG